MLVDIDLHCLAKIVQSLADLDGVIMQGAKSCPKLPHLFQEHKNHIYSLAQLVDECQKNAKQFANIGKGE